MPDFKGFDDWVEIFRGGEQTDSSGEKQDGNALIDKALTRFDPTFYEPPAVVGHPKENAPAYGWVSGLKRDGDLLLAKFDDVDPTFAEMVKAGRFKTRSASFYADGTLRHVGFLGAQPPAVKGLKNMAFKDNQAFVSFEEPMDVLAGNPMPEIDETQARGLLEWLTGLIGKKEKDIPKGEQKMAEDFNKEQVEAMLKEQAAMFQKQIDELKTAQPKDKDADKKKEEDKEKEQEEAVKAAKEEARKEAEAEFAERQRKALREQTEKDIASFCESGLKEGRIIPAWTDMGLKEFMLTLGDEETHDFSESQKGVNQLGWFRQFMAELPKVVEFKEVAGRDSDVKGGNASEKLNALVQKRMMEKKIGYGPAFSEIQTENPDLVAEYQQEIA